MSVINALLLPFLNARTTRCTSGCAETDSICATMSVFFGGPAVAAEKDCDSGEQDLRGLVLNVARTGPRTLTITPRVNVRHVSDETVSF